MSDAEEVFRAFEEKWPTPSRVRIYLVTEERPAAAELSNAVPDYEVVYPHSDRDIALLRTTTIESEEEFQQECERVASIIAPFLTHDSHLGCLYDDSSGTQFRMELRKSGGNPVFLVEDDG